MEEKRFWFLLGDEAKGPFSAAEMLGFDLEDSTPVTDDIESVQWHTAAYFDFEEIDSKANNENRHQPNSTRFTLRMESSTYQFYYRKDGQMRGPLSAKKIAKLGLSPDTLVTESSINGLWIAASIFDFQMLAEDEEELHNVTSSASGKNTMAGLIWFAVGVVITVVSYSNAAPGGTYIVAIGAIIGGLVQFFSGLAGDAGDTHINYPEREYYTEDGQSANEGVPVGDEVLLSPEEIDELYAEFNLSPNATDEDVRRVYRMMVKRYHPDRHNATSEEDRAKATQRFLDISEAYELIKRLRKMK